MASATTHRLLLLRRQTNNHLNHPFYPLHHFSSSSENPPNPNSEPPTNSTTQSQPAGAKPSLSSFMNDVKSTLQREPRTDSVFTPRRSQSGSSILEITRNLSEFRRRTSAPPPQSSSEDFVTMQELYKRNVLPNSQGSSSPSAPSSLKPSLDSIRDSLRSLRATAQMSNDPKPIDRTASFRFRESLKQQGGSDQNRDLGSGSAMRSIFGGEEKDKSMEFLRIYNYDELGQKLRTLRPGKTKGKWFTFGELKDRLVKLSEIEEESQNRLNMGLSYRDLRESIVLIGSKEKEEKKKRILQPLNVMGLGQLGGAPSYMMSPPKDELVEKYFHPDNLSSAEKLKLELKKVRDEFKLSESDCGSARVQVAQLTTKIKHLSSVLHKKDKHSRHGLQAMVQKRKKLLKYLRRTDWDSYCLVLSKLGLRDNPDIKA